MSIYSNNFNFMIYSRQFSNINNVTVTFAGLTGSTTLGLFCSVLKSFKTDPNSFSFSEFLQEIDRFLSKEIDKIVDFGITGDSLTGNFGIGGTVESICTSLCHFNETLPETLKKHLILLPTSLGTEILPHFRTCPNDFYASASLPQLLSILRSRKISLSLIAPGLSDSTVVEQFIVFKCNEKIGNASKLTESLGSDWTVRLSAGLTGEEPAAIPVAKAIDENELLNQTLIKLSLMPPEDRVVALKTLLDPTTSTFSSSFRQKFAAAVKSRLQLQESTANNNNTLNSATNPAANTQPVLSSLPSTPSAQPRPPISFTQRRASQDSATNFWGGCIRFLEKQQSFVFRVQFVIVDSQTPLPRTSLENWPAELNLTGLLDSKKESIQSGLSVGYAFRVNVASADASVASYLMSKMCQGPPSAQQTGNNSSTKLSSPSHLACFRISQDVLIMFRVLSSDDQQFIGYLIDRRFPKTNLTTAAQAASNAINSLTAMKGSMTTTLSGGMEGINLTGRRPSFDVKMSSFPTKPTPSAVPVMTQQQMQVMHQTRQPLQHPQSHPQSQQPQTHPQVPQQKPAPTMTTNYISYPQFIHQQQQHRSLAKIAAISSTTVTSNQLLTDPQAILQKLRPQRSSAVEPVPAPLPQSNKQEQVAEEQELAQSFVDAWLN